MLKQPEGKSQSSQREKGRIMIPLREKTDTGNVKDMKGESVPMGSFTANTRHTIQHLTRWFAAGSTTNPP